MRRSGSSSCILRPKTERLAAATKYPVSTLRNGAPIQSPLPRQPSVTVFTTTRLPNISAERYWVLSEIGQTCKGIHFLDDSVELPADQRIFDANFYILYMLWKPQEYSSAELFMELILKTVQKFQNRVKEIAEDDSKPFELYLVVDKIAVLSENILDSSLLEVNHVLDTKTAEKLSQLITSNDLLRCALSGISIGVSNQIRAAPGLVEAVLSILSYGATERRRSAKQLYPIGQMRDDATKSSIVVVCRNDDDLLGLDPQQDTDAVQGVHQSVIRAEWNGQGDHETFADRAHVVWRKMNSLTELSYAAMMDDASMSMFSVENLSTVLAVTVFILSLAHVWNTFAVPYFE